MTFDILNNKLNSFKVLFRFQRVDFVNDYKKLSERLLNPSESTITCSFNSPPKFTGATDE